jgi:hypothetical protein
MENKLAIVIPYYKIDFFEETLNSLKQQTDNRYTLYIGNDASPNDPLPLIEKYFAEGDYHYFDYKVNLGGKNLALQWERILENVTQDWVQILGDDDLIEKNFVKEFYQIIETTKNDEFSIIKCGFVWVDDQMNIIENNVYDFNMISPISLFIKKYNNEIRSSLSENIYKTKIINKIKFQKIPLAWGSDDLTLLSFSDNKPIKYLPKKLLNVRVSQKSISGSDENIELKINAYQEFRRITIFKYSKSLPKGFIKNIITDYLMKAYFKKLSYDYRVIFILLKNFQIISFLKAIKILYYIKCSNK